MIKASEYAARRSKLFEKLEEGSAMLIYAGVAKSSSADETYPFEVNRNFYYLTGIEQENSALLLIKSEGEFKEFLFIDPYNPAKEKWYGKKLEVAEARAISGVHNVLLTTALTAKLDTILNDKRMEYGRISALYLDLEKELKIAEQTSTNDFKNALLTVYPEIEIKDVYPLIIRLRMVKSKAEVDEFRRAIEITALGIQAVMAKARSGLHEYELADEFLKVINDESGYQGLSFNTIMASGIHSTILHYPKPLDRIKKGDMLLMDLGARNHYYCADISRTIPVEGKFTEQQKMIYSIVLGCNKAIANYARPGVTIAELQSRTKEYLASELVSKGLLEKKQDITKYYFHSVSHHIGLDTHDPSERDLPLEEGNIISNEPGLYMPELGFGVRIEDDLLITKKGCEVLSEDIIKSVEDIERFYKQRH